MLLCYGQPCCTIRQFKIYAFVTTIDGDPIMGKALKNIKSYTLTRYSPPRKATV